MNGPCRGLLCIVIACNAACACDAPSGATDLANQAGDCKALLREIRELSKVTWQDCIAKAPPARDVAVEVSKGRAPPPKPVDTYDRAHCMLLDPSNTDIDKCLLDAVSDESGVNNPVCPKTKQSVTLGDLAFFVLADRHPGLWTAAFPARRGEIAGGYHEWVAVSGNRKKLQDEVAKALAVKESGHAAAWPALPAPPSAVGSPCEITGAVELWSHDACLWRFETDDTIHPGVLACVDKNRSVIAKHGSCSAKRIFKERICRLAAEVKTRDQTFQECMAQDVPLGPSVKAGGI